MNADKEFIAIFPKRRSASKCVLFDFDGTLVVGANGRPGYMAETNPDNFVLLHGVKEQLDKYISRSVLVVIVSNQSHLTDAKMEMFNKFNALFNNKLCILIATKNNDYRKPKRGFIDLLKTTYGEELKIAFHCGDAAEGFSRDPRYIWSGVDFEFAAEAGLLFKTPVDVFGTNFYTAVPDSRTRLVVMMGNPGSGKTSVSKRLEEENGFIRYSQDELPSGKKLTSASIIAEIKDHILNGHYVVVDATHASKASRDVWADLADKCNAKMQIMWCVLDGRVYNERRTENKVPAVAYNVYSKYFERPEEENTIVIS